MERDIAIAGGHGAAIMTDNQAMTGSAMSPLKRMLRAPFTGRTWAELGYTLASLPLAFAALAFTVATLGHGVLWGVSAPGVRRFGAASRSLARDLLGEHVAAPPRLRSVQRVKVATPDVERLAGAAAAAGGKVREWETRPGVTVKNLPQPRLAELAAEANVSVHSMRPGNEVMNWLGGRILDPATWRARGYFAVKLPLAVIGMAGAAGCWLGGLSYLTFPVWRPLLSHHFLAEAHLPGVAVSFALVPFGAALLLAGPWLTHGITQADRWLIRGLLGPGTPAERIRALEESRAHAVEDSAARLRSIERNLHDGTQAQLVALAMKLGLASKKLHGASPAEMARITQLVDEAHRGALEAISDLRTLARGIHPPVLDKGLADALATLANRSAVPVDLVTDIRERPSDAIETIAYFSAAELLTNVAKHSGARHAALEAVHVPGLLRVRVTDDGAGGARPVANGGLRGLADRVRTVDGRLEISSPRGGPTAVTVELPSHA